MGNSWDIHGNFMGFYGEHSRHRPSNWQWFGPLPRSQAKGLDGMPKAQFKVSCRSVDPVRLDVKHLGVDHSSANVQVVEGGQKIEIHIEFLESAWKSTWQIGESARNSYEMLCSYIPEVLTVLKIPFWDILRVDSIVWSQRSQRGSLIRELLH